MKVDAASTIVRTANSVVDKPSQAIAVTSPIHATIMSSLENGAPASTLHAKARLKHKVSRPLSGGLFARETSDGEDRRHRRVRSRR
jgi:hypothetical protein